MTSLTTIMTQLKANVKFQTTPIPFTDTDYNDLVVQGAKRLYTDEGIENNFKTDYDSILEELSRNLTLTEEEYIIVASEIAFLKQIKGDVSQIMGYSTNALNITGANKPFENLSKDIIDLESRLSQLAWKFSHRSV